MIDQFINNSIPPITNFQLTKNNPQNKIQYESLIKNKHITKLKCIFSCGKFQMTFIIKKNIQKDNIEQILSSYNSDIIPLFFKKIRTNRLLSVINDKLYTSRYKYNTISKITNEALFFPEYNFDEKSKILTLNFVKYPLFKNITQIDEQIEKDCCSILFIIGSKKEYEYLFTTRDLNNSN